MSPGKKVLIVDDDPGQIAFLEGRTKRILNDWEVFQARDVDEALGVIAEHPDLGAAVVDLFLSDPPVGRGEGLAVLAALQQSAPRCYRILVSKKANSRPQARETDPDIDRYVSLRYVDANPVAELRKALAEARKQYRHYVESGAAP